MKSYALFAQYLLRLLGTATAVRITVDSYMPLSVEDIGPDGEGRRQIALFHTGEQNGDLMRDPEIVFVVVVSAEVTIAEPVSFRNNYAGILQEVYWYNDQGRRTHVLPGLRRELRDFSRLWFSNLQEQRFFSKIAKWVQVAP